DGGDGCDANCATEVCGNGVVQDLLGETCDDGNTDPGDGCDGTCRSETTCGNNALDDGEECDDGNATDGDGCDAACILEACGNGVVQAGEQCDDGNTTPGDGCDGSCQSELAPVELLASHDVCLNVADGAQTFRMRLFDDTTPGAQFLLVPDANALPGPAAEVALAPDGEFTAAVDGPEDVGDYSFALASTAARFDIFNMKVVNDPAPMPFPAATRPFRLGMVPTQGRYNFTFSDGASINLPHTAPAVAVLQPIGASELIVVQTFPEWTEPYDALTNSLIPTANGLRRTGRDIIVALDVFGSGFRDRISLPTDDSAEICSACGLGAPDASGQFCTGGAVLFNCETLRTRLGDYAEAVADAIHPPYLILGVEMDLYQYSLPGDYANFAAAFKAAADRVKIVSPETKVFVTIQYEGLISLAVFTNPFAPNKDTVIRDKIAAVLSPLAPQNELYAITTFPEIMRKFQRRGDDFKLPPLPIPLPTWDDPADIPDEYYKYVTDFVGTPGYPPAAAVMESGWSTRDIDTFTCEDWAFFPLTKAGATNALDGVSDPALTYRSEADQVRAFHRMVELMYAQVHPEFLVWFYARDPSQVGVAPVLPIFQTMGFRRDVFDFDGACTGTPDTPINESKITVVGEASKDGLCDWLRLLELPYAP
ncbi:MAG: DUF4215 domain-containing protein, partial [Myxococcales bacterium]|nr:DUF4215 domain-containing protein [Myxococcales bacterium]